MDSLSPESKLLGCKPSKNRYLTAKNNTSKIDINTELYSLRSAGGHIHLGDNN